MTEKVSAFMMAVLPGAPRRGRASRVALLAAVGLCGLCLHGALSGAEGYKSEALDEKPPETVAEKVRAAVAEKGLRITDPAGKPYADVWLARALKTQKAQDKLGVDYGHVPDGTLLAVIRFHERTGDFRGKTFPAGTFTCRKATMPEDGNHLGVAPTKDFALLCRGEDDTTADVVELEKVVELSQKASKRKHPATLYLMKLFDEAKDAPRLFEDEELDYWILDCQVPRSEKDGAPVRLSLVLVGETEEY